MGRSVKNTSCGNSNGAITLNVSGGTGPCTYAWTGGLTGASPINVASGTYTVTVTGSGTPACSATETYTVGASTAVTATNVITPVSCGQANGAITLTTSGGTAPYTYAWTGGLTGSNPTGLNAGNYTVTITDSGTPQCSFTATYNVPSLSSLAVAETLTQPNCGNDNGAISVNVTGGPAPYTYAWTGGLTGTGGNNLAPGTYTVTVTDSGTPACSITETYTLNPSTAVTKAETVTNTSCGNSNGAITLNVSGGTSPYTYAWTGGLTGASPINVASGTYTVTVTGSGTPACTATESYTVGASTAVTATNVITPVSCGQANGSITLTTSGGTGPYTYAWTGGLTGSNPTGLNAGNYTVTITDSGTPSM